MISDITELTQVNFLTGKSKSISKYCVTFDGKYETVLKVAESVEQNLVSPLSEKMFEVCITKEKVSDVEKIPGVTALLIL